VSEEETKKQRLIAETERLLDHVKELPPSQPGYEHLPYRRADQHSSSISKLVKDAAEWLSIYAEKPDAFAAKPWLQKQLSGDDRAALRWPIEDVIRDLTYIRNALTAESGKEELADDMKNPPKPIVDREAQAELQPTSLVAESEDAALSPTGTDSANRTEAPAETKLSTAMSPGANHNDTPTAGRTAREIAAEKGDLGLLQADGKRKRAVTLDTARRFGGVSRRAIDDAVARGSLKTEGKRQQRRVLVDSLLKYFPPEK